MILGQLRTGARSTTYAALASTWVPGTVDSNLHNPQVATLRLGDDDDNALIMVVIRQQPTSSSKWVAEHNNE